jgi:DNA-binding PadR family transcriptional regulator
MAEARRLTTTSYAILGLLALRSWSSYELAKQLRRSLSHFWPRAESNIYAEPKRLVAASLAVARHEHSGGRRRTLYSITAQGRRALRAWLSDPRGDTRFESEPVLKLFFADQGTKKDLLATVRAMRSAALQEKQHLTAIAGEYRDGAGPFPERLALSLVWVDLISSQLDATIAWAERIMPMIEGWRATGQGEAPVWPRALLDDLGMPAQRAGSS